MKASIGTIVESDFGRGPIVAITKEWVVHDCGDGHEAALPRDEGAYWIPVTEYGDEGTMYHDMDMQDRKAK